MIYRSTADLSEVAVHSFPRDFFAEGSRAPAGLIVLSWRESVALQWDVESARIVGTFDYDRDGWGICFDGAHYITSDGSNCLTFRALGDMSPIKELPIRLPGRPLAGLNDLHWSSPTGTAKSIFYLFVLVSMSRCLRIRRSLRALWRSAAAMLVTPARRSRLIETFRRVAMTRGALPVRTREASSA